MKLLGITLVLALYTTVAFAQPRPNPCGGKPNPTLENPCGGRPMPPPPRPARLQADPTKTYAIRIDADDAVDGAADAKVTIVDAYDYACPYCEHVRPTIAELKAKYGKDLRVVYKQFVVHATTATAGSLAACAANRQHKFAEVDAALWDGYKNGKLDKDVDGTKCWTTKEGCPIANAAARAANLDLAKFMADMTACDAVVKSSMAEQSTSFGVGAIPQFWINGRTITGAQPIENFVALIDEELRKADSRIKAGTKADRYYQQWVVDKGEKKLTTPPPPAKPRPNPCGGKPMPPSNPCGM